MKRKRREILTAKGPSHNPQSEDQLRNPESQDRVHRQASSETEVYIKNPAKAQTGKPEISMLDEKQKFTSSAKKLSLDAKTSLRDQRKDTIEFKGPVETYVDAAEFPEEDFSYDYQENVFGKKVHLADVFQENSRKKNQRPVRKFELAETVTTTHLTKITREDQFGPIKPGEVSIEEPDNS